MLIVTTEKRLRRIIQEEVAKTPSVPGSTIAWKALADRISGELGTTVIAAGCRRPNPNQRG